MAEGACTHLESLLDRKLVSLPCRHHIYEIILKNVFDTKYGKSSAPETIIFNRFANEWSQIEQNEFQHGLEDEFIRSKISDHDSEQIKEFCSKQLQKMQIRADYQELLQLTISFLGGDSTPFRTCGATSHARFMSKAIYCLKIFLFRKQFKLTEREHNSIRDISIFVVKLYIKVWYGCTKAIEAPNQDLNFLKEAFKYADVDKIVSDAVVRKFKNHLWYLTPETVGLAFLDSNVSLDLKRKMVDRLKAKVPAVTFIVYRKYLDPIHLTKCDLADFVSKKTKDFFTSFDLRMDFLQEDPSTWESNLEYQTATDLLHNLFVVNDCAERGVKFMKDYNRVLTNDEEQLQLILQAADSYNKMYPMHTKSALTG